jgi:multidrug efflux pump
MVPLAGLVAVREGVAPRELNHFGQRRSATITANLATGYAIGDALKSIEEAARRVLPPGFALDYNGISREFRVSTGGLYFTFLLALAFIYLVLSAQFESFRDPFIIMLTVPLSMTGALAALYLTRTTLVSSQIGLVSNRPDHEAHPDRRVLERVRLQGRASATRWSGCRAPPAADPDHRRDGLGAIPLALGAGAESRKPSAGSSSAGCSSARCSRCSRATVTPARARHHLPGTGRATGLSRA